ncbi:maleylpyruvate isomerase N-terminal domain-containing protein [Saccharopolyspora indica]|uniref:maleylpyruvate isomerase N-terminal domain-containing protein n=1 Tax=Saccharopolyspora indica TaxID=1229659 RepID=UPI0022EA167E|nr:maleylpyruvate isomerase N-terminal domain-containing protein [Saccharopolyspora indica]MDA3649741.1 maleylpyruvate isomerase N-terminal domain-containing protein [Saccharopolyspora indica]
MTTMSRAYLQAAQAAVNLLRDPAVAAVWDRPSALPEFSVRGLAGHLGSQVLHVSGLLAKEPTAERPFSLTEFYAAADAFHTGLDSDVNVRIRDMGEELAARGIEVLAAEVASAVEEQRTALSAEAADRVVSFGGRPVRLADFLLTRMMEIAVHSDDLAHSAGIETPELPEEVVEPVLALLAKLAVVRHGQTAVLRALSRAERAPSTIAAV